MKKKNISLILSTIVFLLSFSVCLSGCNNSSKGSSGGLGVLGYIVGIGMIIGGAVALFADGKKHGIIYVVGEILMVILLVTFG